MAADPVPHRAEPGLSRAEAEDVLFHEAALIDDRRFSEWLELFTPDGIYWVPVGEGDTDPERQVSIIYDRAPQRAFRAERMEHRHNWSQDPPPRVAHLITNVVVGRTPAGEVEVRSNQMVCVARLEDTTFLPSRCTHVLRHDGSRWLIALKKVRLLGSDQYLTPDTITLL